jgi:hypothetical protein
MPTTTATLPAGMRRDDSSPYTDRHGTVWPTLFSGTIEGVDDHYALDEIINRMQPMSALVLTDSENGTIFIHAYDEASAQWLERALTAIAQQVAQYVPPREPTLAEKLGDLHVA